MPTPALLRLARDIAALTGDDDSAPRVAERLRPALAEPDLLAPDERVASPDGYTQHLLHVDPAGRFSIVALVWGPGQSTPPHDHVAWCVVGVYQGEELETVYRVAPAGGAAEIVPVAARRCRAGEVVWLAPGEAGDLHRVENPTAGTSVSIHVYGADIGRLGSSIRARYRLPPSRRESPGGLPPDTLNERIGVLVRREVEARILAPIIEALGREFGRDRVVEIVRRTIVDIAREQGRQMASRAGDRSLPAFAGTLEAWTRGGALEVTVREAGESRFAFDVTRCRYAELYRSLGIPELGAVLSCNRDGALIEGFAPDVELTRTQTIMQGAPFCDFRYARRPAPARSDADGE